MPLVAASIRTVSPQSLVGWSSLAPSGDSLLALSTEISPNNQVDEAEEIHCHVMSVLSDPIIPLDKFSSFTRLVRITAWILRSFVTVDQLASQVACQLARLMRLFAIGSNSLNPHTFQVN